jgi:hypothetical protein
MNTDLQQLPQTPPTTSLPTQSKAHKTFAQKTRMMLLEIVAPLIWVYVCVKLFVFDIDTWVLSQIIPNHIWIINLKLFILLGALAIIWLLIGTKRFFLSFLYVLFYPLLLVLIFIPWFIFKQKSWTFAFAVINSTISFFKSLKYSFITTALFLGSLACVFAFNNHYILWSAVVILLILTVANYIRKAWFALKPSEIFGVQLSLFKRLRNISKSTYTLDEDIRDIQLVNMTTQQLQKWTEKLQTAVLFNRICLFVVKKLRDFRNSPWQLVPPILSIIFLIVFTITAFTGINYGLFKINHEWYQYSQYPSVFTFIYYSFNALVLSGISELSSSSVISQSAIMLEKFGGLLLVIIMVTLLFAVRSERNSDELEEVIAGIEQEGSSMEQFIRDEYKVGGIEGALTELQRLKSSMIQFLFKMSQAL